jgi:hypothetical protein
MMGRKNVSRIHRPRPVRPVGVYRLHFGNHCCIPYKNGYILYCFIFAAFILVYSSALDI